MEYFKHNNKYIYEPVLISGLYVHPKRIEDGFEKPFISKVNLTYSYSFHNGYKLEILKGDEVFVVFNNPSNSPKHYEFEYCIYVSRKGEIINDPRDKVNNITYNENDSVESMLENLRLQLEGKLPSFDDIHNNKKPCYSINNGDTFIGFTWDNGLIAIQIEKIDNDYIYYNSMNMSHHNFNTNFGQVEIKKTKIDWLMKYYAKIDFDFEKVKNGELLYKDIINNAIEKYRKQSNEMFNTSFINLTTIQK